MPHIVIKSDIDDNFPLAWHCAIPSLVCLYGK